MKNKRVLLITLILLVMILMTGCLPGNVKYDIKDPAGFLSGIWHGWLAPISLILSFFSDGIHMYEEVNTGVYYDLGFYMAIISGFGGLSLSRKKKKHKK
jgi:hypothetical protein